MSKARSFAPIARPSARVLILGSMPGEASLRARQYYAFPHNQFWPIMGALFGAGRDLPYARRVARLRAHRIALWDVLRQCERAGSLDGAIVRASEVPNDFVTFFRSHRALRAVFFNGGKAQELFRRHVAPALGAEAAHLRYERLPSTSPAHAGLPAAAKLKSWRRIKEFA